MGWVFWCVGLGNCYERNTWGGKGRGEEGGENKDRANWPGWAAREEVNDEAMEQ